MIVEERNGERKREGRGEEGKKGEGREGEEGIRGKLRNGRTKWLIILTCCVIYIHTKQSYFCIISDIARVKEQTTITYKMPPE